MSQSPREPEALAEGTLISHLLELRDRLLRALIAVFVIFIPLVFFSNELFTFVARPLIEKLPGHQREQVVGEEDQRDEDDKDRDECAQEPIAQLEQVRDQGAFGERLRLTRALTHRTCPARRGTPPARRAVVKRGVAGCGSSAKASATP